MYIPTLNKMTDHREIVDFMKRFSFATIVTSEGSKPVATHLPFLIEEDEGKIILKSHFAKANEHWRQVEQEKVLVIFSEPHAYISPAHYEKELNVPTWNYLAVHAYGTGKVVSDPNQVLALLEQTIDQYDLGYKAQWGRLPDDYKLGMIKGIVGFEIEVLEIQGKKKLSQNKTGNEREAIISALANSADSNERAIAEYMAAQKL